MTRTQVVARFYAILAELERRVGGARRLGACHGRMGWPSHGVYFFFEEGEQRSISGAGPRVVRVGTHALRPAGSAKLWSRLSAHRGPSSTGGGNHRGSIFRLLVGDALLGRGRAPVASWGEGQSPGQARRKLGVTTDALAAAETPVERSVSEIIRAMPFLWVRTTPAEYETRAAIERGSIGLLSNHDREPVDPPSGSWLGSHSSRGSVRCSGLWNNQLVDGAFDPDFLGLLERAAAETPPLME